MPIAIHRLKEAQLRSLPAGPAGKRYADGNNLYLQVNANGARSYVFRYELMATTHNMGLGSIETLSLADARAEARRLKLMLLEGIDPLGKRAEAMHAARAQAAREHIDETFAGVAQAFIDKMAPKWKSPRAARQWAASLTKHALPHIGRVHVKDITSAMIVGLLEPMIETAPCQANHVRVRIEMILDYAEAMDLRQGSNPARWKGKLQYSGLPDPYKRERTPHAALRVADAPAFMAKLRSREAMAARLLEWLILTAARTQEGRLARWEEIDLEQRCWNVPAANMKMSRPHRVPLTWVMLDFLKRLRAMPVGLRMAHSGFMFPGDTGQPLSPPSARMLLARMGHSDITVHGFRSTFRDWAAMHSNLPGDFAELALAHKIRDLGNAQGSEMRRDALQAIADLSQAASTQQFDESLFDRALHKLVGSATVRAYQRDDLLERRRDLMHQWSLFLTGDAAEAADDKVVAFPQRVPA